MEDAVRRVTADEAVQIIRSGDTILIGGSGGGHAVPEALLEAVERRFLAEGEPRNITAVHPVGLGDGGSRGAGHLAHEGLLKRAVCGTFVNSPKISDLAIADKIEGYTLPQGALSQLTREVAAGRPGLLTRTGLHTFVDPRHGGGRQSTCAKESLVELVEFRGKEYLFFKPIHFDICFIRGTTADELVAQMVALFKRLYDDSLRTDAAAAGLTTRQVVTLASLIEKETARPEERPLVGAVYRNRLKLGMGMQADPTVIYALQKAGQYDGNLSRSDLQFDSPYNTYRYAGLPPGPIAAPGLASLEAAVRPAPVAHLYFVSRNDGSHVFADTLAEHSRNVQEWQVRYFRERRRQDRAR